MNEVRLKSNSWHNLSFCKSSFIIEIYKWLQVVSMTSNVFTYLLLNTRWKYLYCVYIYSNNYEYKTTGELEQVKKDLTENKAK